MLEHGDLEGPWIIFNFNFRSMEGMGGDTLCPAARIKVRWSNDHQDLTSLILKKMTISLNCPNGKVKYCPDNNIEIDRKGSLSHPVYLLASTGLFPTGCFLMLGSHCVRESWVLWLWPSDSTHFMELTDCFRGLSKTLFHCLKLEQKHISKNYLEICEILIKIAKYTRAKLSRCRWSLQLRIL